jgi:hemin uptake protein HemP
MALRAGASGEGSCICLGAITGEIPTKLGQEKSIGEKIVELARKPTTAAPIGITPSGKKPRIESNYLFQGNSEIVIVHQKEEYNLRITRNGKLILTK